MISLKYLYEQKMTLESDDVIRKKSLPTKIDNVKAKTNTKSKPIKNVVVKPDIDEDIIIRRKAK